MSVAVSSNMVATQRIVIRNWVSRDWKALKSIMTHPKVKGYIESLNQPNGKLMADQQIQNFVNRNLKDIAERG